MSKNYRSRMNGHKKGGVNNPTRPDMPDYTVKILSHLTPDVIQSMAGKVYQAEVLHDDWCNIFKGRTCNCNPDVMPPVEVKG